MDYDTSGQQCRIVLDIQDAGTGAEEFRRQCSGSEPGRSLEHVLAHDLQWPGPLTIPAKAPMMDVLEPSRRSCFGVGSDGLEILGAILAGRKSAMHDIEGIS